MVRMGSNRIPNDVCCWTPPSLTSWATEGYTWTLPRKDEVLSRTALDDLWLKTPERLSWKASLPPFAPTDVGSPNSKESNILCVFEKLLLVTFSIIVFYKFQIELVYLGLHN